MFILTNVYPALVIKMLQMDGKGRGADDVVPYLTVAPLSRARQLMHITAELPPALCTSTPASKNYLPSDVIRVGFALCYKHRQTGNLQMLLCFTILTSSLSFNFLFIIKNPFNLPSWGVPTLTKQCKPFLLISSACCQLYGALSYLKKKALHTSSIKYLFLI